MKKCFKCGKRKSPTDFYKHPGMADGRLNKCKECNKTDVRENRKANIEHYRKYDANRAMRKDRVAARRAYQQTPAGKASLAKAKRKFRENNPIKYGAHCVVNNAVRDGKITKPDNCLICWRTGVRLHGHHDDYAKPLEVRWLCTTCHQEWHAKHGEGLNG